MNIFNKLYAQILEANLSENNVAGGTGSVFSNGNIDIGAGGNELYNSDSYATGDMRIPIALGVKKNKRRKNKRFKNHKIPIQRRNLGFK